MLKRREMAIKRTFQSKLAFQKELKLVNRACRDVACIGPGKSMKSKESTWTEAARAAKHDISSLPYRKERWAAFVKFVKESGGIRMELHKKFAEQYRKMLLTGRPANARMLFDVLDTFEEMNFTVIPLLVIFGVFWIYGHQIIMFLLPYNLNWANVTVSFSYLLSPLQIKFCIIEAQTFSFIDSPINYLKCLWKHLVLH